MQIVDIRVKLLTRTAKLPTKAHETDAGFDIYSDEDVTLGIGESVAVSTGIATEIPQGYYAAVHMRSGLRFKEGLSGLSEGVIDSSYRGEWKVLLCKQLDTGSKLSISKGERIAQFTLHKVPSVRIIEVKELNQTERGEEGFGSTGTV